MIIAIFIFVGESIFAHRFLDIFPALLRQALQMGGFDGVDGPGDEAAAQNESNNGVDCTCASSPCIQYRISPSITPLRIVAGSNGQPVVAI